MREAPLVELVAHTPDPLRVIYLAGRVCYSDKELKEMLDEYTPAKGKIFLEKIFKSGHHSILEHVSFTFYISRISRVCSHQLVRHRIASYSQRSQRYVNEGNAEFVVPTPVEGKYLLQGPISQSLEEIYSWYYWGALQLYRKLVQDGVSKEDARYILPQGITTTLLMTINLRSLVNFMGLRLCNRAQQEIRDLANAMKDCIVNDFPEFAFTLKPRCEHLGYCPEENSCGKYPKKDE